MYEAELKKALAGLSLSVKMFFPAELERVLIEQAREVDRLRADYKFVRSATINEGK